MESTKQDGRIDIPDSAVSVSSKTASPERVYAALADLNRHSVWGSTNAQKKNYGLTSISAPAGTAEVGTEFSSTGIDPMGTFADHSVVTEATRPMLFEYVTEGHLKPKKSGKPGSDTTITHRYEIKESGEGCTVTYRSHISRWTNAPRIMTARLMRPVVKAAMTSTTKRSLRSLIASADQR